MRAALSPIGGGGGGGLSREQREPWNACRVDTRRAVSADESRMNSNGVRPALGPWWGEARARAGRREAHPHGDATGPCVREFASV